MRIRRADEIFCKCRYSSDRVTRVAAGAYSLATPDPIVHYPLDDVTNKIELYEEWCSLDVLSDNL